MVLCAAVADVRDGVGVDGDAAGRAAEGVVTIVTENLVGVVLSRHARAERVGWHDRGVMHEVAESAFVDDIILDFIDLPAGEVVEPQETESGFRMSVRERTVSTWTRWRRCKEEIYYTAWTGTRARMSNARMGAIMVWMSNAWTGAIMVWMSNAWVGAIMVWMSNAWMGAMAWMRSWTGLQRARSGTLRRDDSRFRGGWISLGRLRLDGWTRLRRWAGWTGSGAAIAWFYARAAIAWSSARGYKPLLFCGTGRWGRLGRFGALTGAEFPRRLMPGTWLCGQIASDEEGSGDCQCDDCVFFHLQPPCFWGGIMFFKFHLLI